MLSAAQILLPLLLLAADAGAVARPRGSPAARPPRNSQIDGITSIAPARSQVRQPASVSSRGNGNVSPVVAVSELELEELPAPKSERGDADDRPPIDQTPTDASDGTTLPPDAVLAPGSALSTPYFGPPISEFERRQVAELHDRVLDLEPDAQNRQLIERVRTAVEETEVGIDTTAEEWVTVKDRTRITWGGIVQGDWVGWANDEEFSGQPNYFEFRRLRLRARGEGYGVFDYQVELEFAPEPQLENEVGDDHEDFGGFGVEMKDVCLGIKDNPYLGYIRLGHFMVPAGLSQLTNRRSQTFLERPLPHEFVPGREVGIAAYDQTLDERITWSSGGFLHNLSESAHSTDDDNQGTRLAARLTWTPYYDESTLGRYLIHTGLSYVYTRPKAEDDAPELLPIYRPVRFATRPEIHRGDNLIDTGQINTQDYGVLDLEFAWLHGPFRVESEFVYTAMNEVGSGSTELFGAYCLASYFLTGEQRTYNRTAAVFDEVIPLENFWMVETPCGNAAGWGAWEVAARWSYMDFSAVAGQQLHDLTLGLNWYWNPQTRLMLNWIHPFAHNSPVATVVNAGGDIVATRFEVAF